MFLPRNNELTKYNVKSMRNSPKQRKTTAHLTQRIKFKKKTLVKHYSGIGITNDSCKYYDHVKRETIERILLVLRFLSLNRSINV